MKRVITYGTYDLLHYGHIKLLERAKALGDYLIVGITSDDFDKARGKINVSQTLWERIEAVYKTGLADEIIIEEYPGQKIDDIKKYNIDIFTVGSDWIGQFDYLKDYCEVVYLDRTQGISSSAIRSKNKELSLGLVGESEVLYKFAKESEYVNGLKLTGICTENEELISCRFHNLECITKDYSRLLECVDAVYIVSHPVRHYEQIKEALQKGKHVLCESPIALDISQCKELFELADRNHCIIQEALKTAYSMAYSRMLLQAKSGMIGDIIAIDATCTSLRKVNYQDKDELLTTWNSICCWGPTAMLPIFQLLGTAYKEKHIVSRITNEQYDTFTKIDFLYPHSVATMKVGKGVKSEGELIISGTRGYIYVPAPWWKTDYFEIRYENSEDNKRFFYQLDGEGIRYEIVAFVNAIGLGKNNLYIERKISEEITSVLEDYYMKRNLKEI